MKKVKKEYIGGKGVLIIACGHLNYQGMALNLAASIRVNNPGLKIALATDQPAPGEYQNVLFDLQVQIDDQMIAGNDGEQAFIKAKLYMPDLSPFDETLYLDADQIMIPDRSLVPLFEELKEIDFTSANWGKSEVTTWADMAEVRSIYGEKTFWNYHAELMYFKRTPEVKAFFKKALQIFKDNKMKSAFKFSGANMADELAFGIASMEMDIQPHKAEWFPGFWFSRDLRNSRRNPYELTDHTLYSMAGNNAPNAVKTHYNNLANHYFKVLGLRYAYQYQDKMKFLTNRKKA